MYLSGKVVAQFIVSLSVGLTLSLTLSLFSNALATDKIAKLDGKIEILDIYVRQPPPNAKTTAAYFTIRNVSNQEIKLVGISSPAAARSELHQSLMKDGMMVMKPRHVIAIPAAGELKLSPGGYHLMLMGLSNELKTEHPVKLKLIFDIENAYRELEFTAKVKDMRNQNQSHHHGH